MRDAAWFSAIAAYDEAIRIQPEVAGLYEARGTAYMYAGRHDEALADCSRAIELEPTDAGHWRRRSHAHTIAPTPQPVKSVEDATRAIELDPHHPMGYGHRAIALTQLPTPDWESALADMDRHIELFPRHDPEAYDLRAWIHDNLGNHEEAERVSRVNHICRRIASNQMLLNFGRTRSLGGSKHKIGDSRTPSSERLAATHRWS